MYGWTVDEALEWENTWRVGEETPTGDQMAMHALANEVRRLRSSSKRFALFAGHEFYPYGGLQDLKGTFATIDEAMEEFIATIAAYEIPWADIADLWELKILNLYRNNRWYIASDWFGEQNENEE